MKIITQIVSLKQENNNLTLREIINRYENNATLSYDSLFTIYKWLDRLKQWFSEIENDVNLKEYIKNILNNKPRGKSSTLIYKDAITEDGWGDLTRHNFKEIPY